MSMRKINILVALTILSGTILIISNLAATKLFAFLGVVSMDAGVICFPIMYVVGDLTVEFFGKRLANRVVWWTFITSVLAAGFFMWAVALEPYPGWDGQEAFASVLGVVPRITIGSLVAFVASSLVNNAVFVKIKNGSNSALSARMLGSSAVAKIIDIAVFETIAFYGILPFRDFLLQMIVSYGVGMILESAFNPVSCLIAKWIALYISKSPKSTANSSEVANDCYANRSPEHTGNSAESVNGHQAENFFDVAQDM